MGQAGDGRGGRKDGQAERAFHQVCAEGGRGQPRAEHEAQDQDGEGRQRERDRGEVERQCDVGAEGGEEAPRQDNAGGTHPNRARGGRERPRNCRRTPTGLRLLCSLEFLHFSISKFSLWLDFFSRVKSRAGRRFRDRAGVGIAVQV